MIGIKRLAEHLDISIGTVSRALNGRPDVNETTRKRVLEAAEKLGYVPNQSGRSLRSGVTGVIGFMMKTGHEITGQGDTFFMSVFDGVQTALSRHQLDLVALLCSADEDADDYLRRMVSRGFADGFIISATQRIDRRISFLAERKVPFMTLGRSTTDAGQPWLDSDFEGMGRQIVDRFVAHGHRRIAITVPSDDAMLGHLFLNACREALAKYGLALEPELIFPTTPNETAGLDVARRLLALEHRPTAMFLINHAAATGFYRGLTEAGCIPGRDIAVIGRDSPHSTFLTPSLTRFGEDLRELGIALGEALLSSMPKYAGLYAQGTVRKVWPAELIVGDSDTFRLQVGGGGARGRN